MSMFVKNVGRFTFELANTLDSLFIKFEQFISRLGNRYL
jgi:hypothetical protein